MTLVYEGDGAGTLTVKDSFGEMSLPARKETREGQGDDGTKMTATGIAAFGLVSAVMPDKAAIEACVNDKLPPDQLQDAAQPRGPETGAGEGQCRDQRR